MHTHRHRYRHITDTDICTSIHTDTYTQTHILHTAHRNSSFMDGKMRRRSLRVRCQSFRGVFG